MKLIALRVDKRDITPVIPKQHEEQVGATMAADVVSACIKQSLTVDTYFLLTDSDHIDPNEDVVQHASRCHQSITSYFNDEDDYSSSPSRGEEVGEG